MVSHLARQRRAMAKERGIQMAMVTVRRKRKVDKFT